MHAVSIIDLYEKASLVSSKQKLSIFYAEKKVEKSIEYVTLRV
jgi:hypothetical protein